MGKKHKQPAEFGLAAKADPELPLRILVSWTPGTPSATGSDAGASHKAARAEAIDYAAWLGRTTPIHLQVLSTFIQPWSTTSLSKLGGKYKKWFRAEAAACAVEVEQRLAESGIDKQQCAKEFSLLHDGPNQPQLLTDAAAAFRADLILLSPEQSAPKHRLLAGTTADALLHYSPVALGLTPRGLKFGKNGIKRVNFAFTEEHQQGDTAALRAAAAFAVRLGVPLRIIAFSPSGLVQAPLHNKLSVAQQLTSDWREHSLAAMDRARDLVADEFPQIDVSAEIGIGTGWRGAVDAIKWKKSDIMVLGSSPMSSLARVFLGSTATEILPHLPVPVLVHPAAQ
ncbi:universal stress protein [Corynebacterium lizhenjunii]|uniref:Universal stress protein n=1 Tax=Corynebacterium lizhenjunii TaxID=2709394 RepID=A0A7T0KE19_9CORY|nr:universal stress protein [Corynebacterium lizhenjunii]QPK79073.1 universal stress protein [Corynebacterium lizhenjunii]